MDPATTLTVLGGAFGSAKVLEKLLGPTAEYLGVGLRNWTERSAQNVKRIFDKATARLGDQLDSPGAVPPKVLKGILQNGPFCDDELAAEYFGGVLASSRTEVGRDDRGAAVLALIERLTTYQMRSHFFFYSVIRLLYKGLDTNIGFPEGRAKLQTFVPINAFVVAMELAPNEKLASMWDPLESTCRHASLSIL